MSDTRRRILIFLLVTFGIAWAYAFLAVYPMSRSALASYLPMATKLVTGAIMLAPSIAVIVTRAVTGEGFQGTSHLTSAGFDKTWRYWLAGYLGPVVLAAVGACLYYLVVPGAFDPSMSYAFARTAGNPLVGPASTGILGGVGFVVAAVAAPCQASSPGEGRRTPARGGVAAGLPRAAVACRPGTQALA
nr:hypothetical protein [uncultured Olsenella sp.]